MRFLISVVWSLFFCVSFAQLEMNGVVVSVNGDKIMGTEFFNRMAFLEGVGTVNDGRFVAVPPAFLTIQRLVSERFIMQIAKDKGVAPTPAEVSDELAAQRAANPEQFQRLKDLGVADAAISKQIAMDLAQFKVLTMGIVITDEQVASHYNMNKMIYVRPATVKLRVIVVAKAEDKAKVDAALKTKAFKDVASEMSTDLTKYDGGDLPKIAIDNLPQNVHNEVLRTNAGQTTQWIESEGAFLKYLVETKEEAKQIPLDAKLKKDIKRNMMIIQGRQKNDVNALLVAKMRTAKVEIAAPGLQKLWNLYIADTLRGKAPSK